MWIILSHISTVWGFPISLLKSTENRDNSYRYKKIKIKFNFLLLAVVKTTCNWKAGKTKQSQFISSFIIEPKWQNIYIYIVRKLCNYFPYWTYTIYQKIKIQVNINLVPHKHGSHGSRLPVNDNHYRSKPAPIWISIL